MVIDSSTASPYSSVGGSIASASAIEGGTCSVEVILWSAIVAGVSYWQGARFLCKPDERMMLGCWQLGKSCAINALSHEMVTEVVDCLEIGGEDI
jgi:hypothetical protein